MFWGRLQKLQFSTILSTWVVNIYIYIYIYTVVINLGIGVGRALIHGDEEETLVETLGRMKFMKIAFTNSVSARKKIN